MSARPRRDVPALAPGTRGLRRDPALVVLSREHHAVLVRALGLRRAAARPEGDAAALAAARDFIGLWQAEMRGHFADEEEELLPLAQAFDAAGAARVRDEHVQIAALAAGLQRALAGGFRPRGEPGGRSHGGSVANGCSSAPKPPGGGALASLCGELGELLDDHVRYEERAFFETLQRHLASDELAALAKRLAARRALRGAPSCPASGG